MDLGINLFLFLFFIPLISFIFFLLPNFHQEASRGEAHMKR